MSWLLDSTISPLNRFECISRIHCKPASRLCSDRTLSSIHQFDHHLASHTTPHSNKTTRRSQRVKRQRGKGNEMIPAQIPITSFKTSFNSPFSMKPLLSLSAVWKASLRLYNVSNILRLKRFCNSISRLLFS
jgi:hypothetical protein